MAALDWIFAAVLLASMLIGAWRGALQETRRAHTQWDAALAGHADGAP